MENQEIENKAQQLPGCDAAECEAKPQEIGKKTKKQIHPGSLLLGVAIGAVLSLAMTAALTGGRVFALTGGGSVLTSASLKKLQTLIAMIDSYYYEADEVTGEQLQTGLYAGLVDALDDTYSVYYTSEEIAELQESISGTFSGIGAYVSRDEESGYPKIVGVISGSPAEEAGLLSDDIIYEVEGESMLDVDLDVAVSKIRGEEGTTVHLTIVRSGEADYIEVDIERRSIDSVTAEGEMIDADSGIGYIQITEFDDVTPGQFIPILEDLLEQGMQGLILDLRDNPGGTVTSVTSIASYLIPEGLVFYMEYPDGSREEYETDGENHMDFPIMVLVNGNSASAAEILASAIQDSGAGLVVGTQTYGKGVVQTVYSLPDGTGLKLTTAQYYTRDGHDINKVGVTPDEEVELDAQAYLENGTDTQLEAALKLLTEEMK